MVSEMAMNAVIQKHPNISGSSSITLTTKNTPQQIIIPRGSEGIQVASAMAAGTPNYITVNQLATTQAGSSGTVPLLATGGQVIQGTPFAFSQLQASDFSQAGNAEHGIIYMRLNFYMRY